MTPSSWLSVIGTLAFLIVAHGSPLANLSALMYFDNLTPSSGLQRLEARRRHKKEGSIILINATPYDWRKVYTHSYQLDAKWPETISAGTTAETQVTFKKNRDDQGEVVYEIQHPDSSDGPLRFEIQPYRGRLWTNSNTYAAAHLLGPLAKRITPETNDIDLMFRDDASVSFILAGDLDRNFTSTNTPISFLAGNLQKWGNRTLRQLALPSTHDSGMGIVTHRQNMAGEAGSQCQSLMVRDQLLMGARYLDIRPKLVGPGRMFHGVQQYEDFVVTGHYSHIDVTKLELANDIEWFGADGEAIADIIDDVNSFTRDYNELVILNFSHALDKNYKAFNQEDWNKLLEHLQRLRHRYGAPKDVTDLSILTLDDFIGGKEPHPAVIILLEGFDEGGFQLRYGFDREGFYPSSALPKSGSWTNTDDLARLKEDQFTKMQIGNPQGLFELHWYMSQMWDDAFRATIMETLRDGTHKLIPVSWENSLLEFGDNSNKALWRELWPEMHQLGAGFPNLITVDNLRDSGVKNLAVAINNRFSDRVGS